MRPAPTIFRHTLFMALLLAAALFAFHSSVLFELSRNTGNFWELAQEIGGEHAAGIGTVLVCFLTLFMAHFAEAMAWGWFFWRKKLADSFADGIYFAASSITALGYGDVVLKPPWRVLGAMVAINGLLMFGCSTAFLFLVLQGIWKADG